MPPLKSLTERNRHGGLKQFVINFPVEKLKKTELFLSFVSALSLFPILFSRTFHLFSAAAVSQYHLAFI